MKKFLICFFAFVSSNIVQARPADDIWFRTLQVVRFADAARAGLRPACSPRSSRPIRPEFRIVCQRLEVIPDAVIESAARPFLKIHVSKDLARKAIEFWSTAAGASLSEKMLKEMESGVQDQLSDADLSLMGKRDATDYGIALGSFASDKLQSAAVFQAMYAYATKKPPKVKKTER